MRTLDPSTPAHEQVVPLQHEVDLPLTNVVNALVKLLNSYFAVQSIAISSHVFINLVVFIWLVPVCIEDVELLLQRRLILLKASVAILRLLHSSI